MILKYSKILFSLSPVQILFIFRNTQRKFFFYNNPNCMGHFFPCVILTGYWSQRDITKCLPPMTASFHIVPRRNTRWHSENVFTSDVQNIASERNPQKILATIGRSHKAGKNNVLANEASDDEIKWSIVRNDAIPNCFHPQKDVLTARYYIFNQVNVLALK